MAEKPDALDAAADELYGLTPEEFTAARNARASEEPVALAKQVRALRKPTVAAWAVNLLVRDGQLREAVELSRALRDAQDELDAKELQQLGRQRRQLVASLARRAAELVKDRGATLSPAARDAVSNTVNAAIMDERAAAAVLTGRLVKPLEAGDLEGVVLSDVVAGSVPGVAPATAPPSKDELAQRRARKAAEEAAQAAEHAASEAEKELIRVQARRKKAGERADLLHERIDELRTELDRLVGDADDADDEVQRLDEEQRTAASRARQMQKDAERARDAVPR